MILQASEYEQEQGVRLQDFFDSTHGKFKTSTGRAWAEEVVQRRAQQQQLHDSSQKAPDQVQAADKQNSPNDAMRFTGQAGRAAATTLHC